MANTTYFINAVATVNFEGHVSIPTNVWFEKGRSPQIGSPPSPISGAPSCEFKLDLGRVKPGQSVDTRLKFTCGDGERRSAFAITDEFMSCALRQVAQSLLAGGLAQTQHILVSEPLSFHATQDDDWLENYRGNLRRILGRAFETVQFLPEPFAVYQYYRYGVRHPLVDGNRKYFALVLDFGGGTFDVSVIESTKTGDISQKGRHARPLGAHSKDVGGFEVNRTLARVLVEEAYAGKFEKDRIKKARDNHRRWRTGEIELSALSANNRTFILWYDSFLQVVEREKVTLANKIANWTLTSPIFEWTTVPIPVDPFRPDGDTVPLRISAEFFRRVFIEEIWKRSLRPCIKSALGHAAKELGGRPINVVLLSGGSANLRWLEALVQSEFAEELAGSRMVSLRENYQEVVAKGLAIECARRFYEPKSEFSDVTYNPLYLVLNADQTGPQIRKFKLLSGPEGVKGPTELGELLPAAEALTIGGEVELTWKVRLERPPKRELDYYFMRGTTDHLDVENLYNVASYKVPTRSGTKFASSIKVKLTVRADGTCIPEFIYREDSRGNTLSSARGVPFCIDFVAGNSEVTREAFLGLDFGSATSAVSYVDWHQVALFERRGREAIWLALNELVDLPAPVAVPIKTLLGATRPDGQANASMEALEALLCFASFACWAEASSSPGNRLPKLFQPNWKRSAGPLKRLLWDICQAKGAGHFVDIFRSRLTSDVLKELDEVIQGLDDEKHNKKARGSTDATPIIEKLGNACNAAMDGWAFGYFEGVHKAGFSSQFKGRLRIAHGAPPFHQSAEFSGTTTFSENEAVLVDLRNGAILKLTPLMFWNRPPGPTVWPECMVFDGVCRDGVPDFKNACSASIASRLDGQAQELSEFVKRLLSNELTAEAAAGAQFSIDEIS